MRYVGLITYKKTNIVNFTTTSHTNLDSKHITIVNTYIVNSAQVVCSLKHDCEIKRWSKKSFSIQYK